MNLAIQTCTPIWTGAVKTGRMDRIHETNIVGSLRWWYEAIVRGLGGKACNPTSDVPADRCPQGDGSYCDVCRIFGATGLRRTFRLRMGSGTALFDDSIRSIPLPSGRIHQTRRGQRVGGWYLMGESMMGHAVPLEIIPISSDYREIHFRLVLTLLARHAAIGAKVSNGYGVVNIQKGSEPIQVTSEDLDDLPRAQIPQPRQHSLPDTRDFFFVKMRFEEPTDNQDWWQKIRGIAEALAGQVTDTDGQQANVYHTEDEKNEGLRVQASEHLQTIFRNGLLPMATAVRNYLRFHWLPTLFSSGRTPRRLEEYLFGRTGGKNNIASKINVSHAYRLDNGQWELRVWGWIPCRSPEGISLNRDDFLGELRSALEDVETWNWIFNADHPTPQVTEWHALPCDQTDGIAYLKELLGLGEGGAQ